MNAKTLLPISAVAVFAICAGAMFATGTTQDSVTLTSVKAAHATDIVNMPTVSVTPSAEDLAYFQTYGNAKIVDLAGITVNPAAADLAYFQTYGKAKVVELATVTVTPSAADLREYALQAARVAEQLATR